MSDDDGSFQSLFPTERQRAIAELTRIEGRVEVSELSERFGVTAETIRRDLADLQNQNAIRRVHGGAVAIDRHGFEPLIEVRVDQHDAEKRRIARAAIDEIVDGSSIMIDSGSTLNRFAEAIPPHRGLQIVTNSLITAQVLAAKPGTTVIVLGGEVRSNTFAMVDATTVAGVRPFTVDTLFISGDAVSVSGLTTPYSAEASLKREMVRAARRVVALFDVYKFRQDHFIRFAEWSEVDLLITNSEVDPRIVSEIERQGTAVVLS